MKKVINIILLVVLGVSLSGCEWWDGPGFGVDGEDEWYSYYPIHPIMTKIAMYGCKGTVVDCFSFVEEDIIPSTINIDDQYVEFSEMKEDGKDSVAMKVTINGEQDALKFYHRGGDPVSGVKGESHIETIHILGSKSDNDNNQNLEWNSEFFLWDAFEYEEKTYLVLSSSKSICIEFFSHKEDVLNGDEVQDIINNGKEGEDFNEIPVMGSMSGVDKTAYVIDNRVYLKNSFGNWNYYCNYSVPNSMSINKVETVILIEVEINEPKDNNKIVNIEKIKGRNYFTQTPDEENVNRFYLVSHK